MSTTEPTPSEQPEQPQQQEEPQQQEQPQEDEPKEDSKEEPKEEEEEQQQPKEEPKVDEQPIEEPILVEHEVVPSPIIVDNTQQYRDAYLDREKEYIATVIDDAKNVQNWYKLFLGFLAARRAPILSHLKNTHTHLTDGQMALVETLRLIDMLIVQYQTQYDFIIKNTSLYKQPLHTNINHLPLTTSTGQSDSSILSLAALTTCIYNTNNDYLDVINQLKLYKQELQAHVQEYIFKDCFQLIKQTEKAQNECTLLLDTYISQTNIYYSQRNDIHALTSTKRHNLFQLRNTFIKSILSLWKSHNITCDKVYAITHQYTTADVQRQKTMEIILQQITTQLLQCNTNMNIKLQHTIQQQQYAPTQAHNYTLHLSKLPTTTTNHDITGAIVTTKINPSTTSTTEVSTQVNKQSDKIHDYFIHVDPRLPQSIPTMLTKSSTAKYFTNLPLDIDQTELETIAKTCPKPGVFPNDQTVLKISNMVTKGGLFSDKQCDLIYTKTHQIHLIAHNTTSKEQEDAIVITSTTSPLNSPIVTSTTTSTTTTTSNNKNNIKLIPITHTEVQQHQQPLATEKSTMDQKDNTNNNTKNEQNVKTNEIVQETTPPPTTIITATTPIVTPTTTTTTTTTTPSSIHFFGESLWSLDGAVITATKHEKKDNVLILREMHDSWFKLNGKETIIFPSSQDADEWCEFINNHNKFAAIPPQ